MARISARGAVIALVTALAAAPAIADTPTATTSSPRQSALDPNQVICEKQEVIGSRLATRRICKTRAEWADSRLQDRQEIEKMQTHRGMKGE